MLHKSFLSALTSWLSRRNKHILNVYCSTLPNDSSPEHQKEAVDSIVETKEPNEKTGLKVKKHKVLQYVEQTISHDKEILDIINYMQKVDPNVIDIIQSINWTLKKKDTSTLHLIDKDTAVEFVSLIKNDLLKNMCYVAELNPGFGVLTRELLKTGVPLIHLYEGNIKLHKILEMICTKENDLYSGKVNLISSSKSNLFGLTRVFYNDEIIDETYQHNFKAIESKNWDDETYMQVIGAIDSYNLFTYIIKSLIFRYGFMFYGRPVFYIAVLPSLWHRYNDIVTDKRLYTYTKVMFKLMFDCDLLGTLNRKAFLPWPVRKQAVHKRCRLTTKQDCEQIYVIKLEPRADIYSHLSQKDWITFSYFVKHHMQRRITRVIPALEQWVPSCGIRLIAKDYTIYTQFGDLTPTQILELFKEFKSWPEFQESHFIGSMTDSLGAYHWNF